MRYVCLPINKPSQDRHVAKIPKKIMMTIVFTPDNPKLIPTGKLSILTRKEREASCKPIGLIIVFVLT